MYALGVIYVACLAGIASGGPLTPGGSRPGMTRRGGSGRAGLAGTGERPRAHRSTRCPPLWPRCGRPASGPIRQERPSAAHAAVMSRQLLPGSGPVRRGGPRGLGAGPRTEPTPAELAAAGPGSASPEFCRARFRVPVR